VGARDERRQAPAGEAEAVKFPETLPYECPVAGCDVVLDLPASAKEAPSTDPRYVGFMVIVEKQGAIDHLREGHGVG
jgi:hypothetical protein